VGEALSYLIENSLGRVYADRIGALFSFVAKADYPISEEHLAKLIKGYKIASLMHLSAEY
jgi:hypothetical protein